MSTAAPAEGSNEPRWATSCIDHLTELLSDSGSARRALRPAARLPPADVPTAHRYLVPWLAGASADREAALYRVAGFMAAIPNGSSLQREDLGGALAAFDKHLGTRGSTEEMTPRERRLARLVQAPFPVLVNQIYPVLTQLARENLLPDWAVLLRDLHRWPRSCGDVGKRWMRSYYTANPITR
ncbi:type I-E CRISPR-associated protein Cse2/CasB [Allokutzneria sp. NRRL B-24872]|uniref:type I-E CRISPR-associated protein Cse2/CasB n=1 Tax=Allokutzneria sp. NRRL B-24872 TaxID=1137961 RepID=UPI000A36E97F|nr:type I-E CRISPR-associated protein Cse2/CasB [Allokutzneria sp. NRRL B-24872]